MQEVTAKRIDVLTIEENSLGRNSAYLICVVNEIIFVSPPRVASRACTFRIFFPAANIWQRKG